jgi:dTDP-4-dehydrorhamnose reductase
MMKNILILGLNSYVGYFLSQSLSKSHNVTGISRKEIDPEHGAKLVLGDSTDTNFLKEVIANEKIDTVVNCVSMGVVDECEKNQDEAKRLNADHVISLVQLLNELNVKLVHFSSNAVYCGEKPPYSENSLREPKNFYGKMKSLADDYVKENSKSHLLLRPMTLFGPKKDFHRNNPATMILHFLSQNKDMKLVNDLYGNLLFIDDFVEVISRLIDKGKEGEFNVSGDDNVNRYEFGLLVKNGLEECSSEISECDSDAFPSLAPRAPDTSFSNQKVKTELDFNFTPIQEAVIETIRRMTK